jgi:hypothetical protein
MPDDHAEIKGSAMNEGGHRAPLMEPGAALEGGIVMNSMADHINPGLATKPWKTPLASE